MPARPVVPRREPSRAPLVGAMAVLLILLRALALAPLLGAGGCAPAPGASPCPAPDGASPWALDPGPSGGVPDAARTGATDTAGDVPGGEVPAASASDDVARPDPGAGSAERDVPEVADATPPRRDAAPAPGDAASDRPVCPAPGALVITEILADPSRVVDPLGEYVEVGNLGDAPLDLRGWEIRAGTKHHRVEDPVPVVVRPGGRAVLAASADPMVNGGFRADHAWRGLALGNVSGDVGLWCDGVLVDRVAWHDDAWPMVPGAAMVLDPGCRDAATNDAPAFWCRAQDAFGLGDRGTPGLPDGPCASGSCGDGVHQAWEDCEDGNALSGDGCARDCRIEAFRPGDVVVTEFHHSPEAAGSPGEFFEIHNPTDAAIDVAGWTLSDDRNDRVRILPPSGTLVLPPGGYAVLARRDDPARNGGFPADWAYGDRFVLGTPADRLVLSWNGIEIDRVDYRIGADDWPDARGRSLSLDGTCIDAELNDCGAFWCATPPELRLPGGDAATPGGPNPPCP